MAEKPRGKPVGKRPASADPEPGRLGTDDRGNKTWQWSDENKDLLADDSPGAAERVRALVDPKLEVKEDQDQSKSGIDTGGRRLKVGYNPYNSGALGKNSWKKKKNLRELSKWIELKKRMAAKKKDEE